MPAQLAAARLSPGVVGRAAVLRRDRAPSVGNTLRIVTEGLVDAEVAAVSGCQPAVAINKTGPLTKTALPNALAGPSGAYRLNLSNAAFPITALLGPDVETVSSGPAYATGAGFGVLAQAARFSRFHPRSYQPRERRTMWTTDSITGTSTSTPTTVDRAAPD